MNTEAVLNTQTFAPATVPNGRTLYWSVRRELWENRSLYIAPLAVAVLNLLGFLASLIWSSPSGMGGLDLEMDPLLLSTPYSHTAMLLTLTGLLVGIFYSLDALYSERRDRSILFWKSLPVSDLTTVLSKAATVLVVLPAMIFAMVIAMQIIMLLLSSFFLLIRGMSVLAYWQHLPLLQLQLVLLYSLIVLALWQAPLCAWLLLVSAWAKRTPLLWAVLPPLALCLVELIAFHTWHLGGLLKDRFVGFNDSAFDWNMPDGSHVDPHMILLSHLSPGRFLSSPGLWIGLVAAAALLAAAVRLRRYREPI